MQYSAALHPHYPEASVALTSTSQLSQICLVYIEFLLAWFSLVQPESSLIPGIQLWHTTRIYLHTVRCSSSTSSFMNDLSLLSPLKFKVDDAVSVQSSEAFVANHINLG